MFKDRDLAIEIEKESADALGFPPDANEQPPEEIGNEQPVGVEDDGPDSPGGGAEIKWPSIEISYPAEPSGPPPVENSLRSEAVSDEQPAEVEEAGPAPTDGAEIIWPGVHSNQQPLEVPRVDATKDDSPPVVGNEQPVESLEAGPDSGGNGRLITWPGVHSNTEVEENQDSNSNEAAVATENDVETPVHTDAGVSSKVTEEEIIRPEIQPIPPKDEAELLNPVMNEKKDAKVSNVDPAEPEEAGPQSTDGRLISWPVIHNNSDGSDAQRSPEVSDVDSDSHQEELNESDTSDSVDGDESVDTPIIRTKTATIPASSGSLSNSSEPNVNSEGGVLAALIAARKFARDLASALLTEVREWSSFIQAFKPRTLRFLTTPLLLALSSKQAF